MFSEVYAMGAAPPGDSGAAAPTVGFFAPLIIILFIFYILIWLPQKKERKKTEAMRAGLKKGDKIVTAGGIRGIVANVKGNVVTVKVADNVKMDFSRSAISQVEKGSE